MDQPLKQGPSVATGMLTDSEATSQSVHALARYARYVGYRAMYDGEQWDVERSPGERRLTFNYCRVFVNKAASYLFGKPVGYAAFADGQAGASTRKKRRAGDGARRVEDYIEAVHHENSVAALDLDMAIMSGCLGDGAFTVRWDTSLDGGKGMPRITGVDPASIDARWRGDDLRTLTWVKQRYWVSEVELAEAQRSVLRLAGAGSSDPYEPVLAEEEWTAEQWRLSVAGVIVDGGGNPYGTIPYVIFPNLRVPGEFWGESDLADIVEIQQELNWRMSVLALLLDVAGNPIAVVTGATDTANLRLGPRQLWELPAGATADVLDLLKSGGGDAHLKYVDLLYRTMHDVSEMPRTSFGDSSGSSQARSGVALEIELQPLLHKLARKNLIWSSALVRRTQLMLAVARVHGVDLPSVRLRVSWPPVLPQDRAALVQQETMLISSGVHSVTQSMEALGEDDPDGRLDEVIEENSRIMEAGLGAPLGSKVGAFGGGGSSAGTPGSLQSASGQGAKETDAAAAAAKVNGGGGGSG